MPVSLGMFVYMLAQLVTSGIMIKDLQGLELACVCAVLGSGSSSCPLAFLGLPDYLWGAYFLIATAAPFGLTVKNSWGF